MIHLMPVVEEAATNSLAYAETEVAADSTIAFTNLMPGKYWVLAQTADAANSYKHQLAWDATARAALRKAAEANPQTIELSACMRLGDYQIK